MKKSVLIIIIFIQSFLTLFAQSGSINNFLGSGGMFNIEDGTTTFLRIDQPTGFINLSNCINLVNTNDGKTGIIFKDGIRFMHNYQAPATRGFNTFVGMNAGNFTLNSGTFAEASYNTGVGESSLTSLTTGWSNSAFGNYSLQSNEDGYANSSFGVQTLAENISGYRNSALGFFALNENTTGFQNSAFGEQSLTKNRDGSRNSAFGNNSLSNNTNGSYNTALGDYAGSNLTTGSNNIFIGSDVYASSPTVSNEIVLGNNRITALRCNVTSISSLSDKRDKKNIRDLQLGIDFLMKVKPRLFNWDRREWYENGKPDGSKMKGTPTAGFIAQELDTAQTNADAEWLNLVLKSNPERLEVTAGNLLPVMVKAIQELKTENNELKEELVRIKKSISDEVDKQITAALLKAINKESNSVKVSSIEK